MTHQHSYIQPLCVDQLHPRTVQHTLPLHDALPISLPHALTPAREKGATAQQQNRRSGSDPVPPLPGGCECVWERGQGGDRKSTRLNARHRVNSYAVYDLINVYGLHTLWYFQTNQTS